MGFRFTLLAGVCAAIAIAGCGKSAPPPQAPPTVPVPVSPPAAHQADAPSATQAAKDGENAHPGRKLSLDLPEMGDWKQAPRDLVPKEWKAGFVSMETKAMVLMDLTVDGPPAVMATPVIQGILHDGGAKCGPLTPLADSSGMSFTIDEGNGTLGKVALREMGEKPGAYVLQLYGHWTKAASKAASQQFDYMVQHAKLE